MLVFFLLRDYQAHGCQIMSIIKKGLTTDSPFFSLNISKLDDSIETKVFKMLFRIRQKSKKKLIKVLSFPLKLI